MLEIGSSSWALDQIKKMCKELIENLCNLLQPIEKSFIWTKKGVNFL
jgi:hypothetical protein